MEWVTILDSLIGLFFFIGLILYLVILTRKVRIVHNRSLYFLISFNGFLLIEGLFVISRNPLVISILNLFAQLSLVLFTYNAFNLDRQIPIRNHIYLCIIIAGFSITLASLSQIENNSMYENIHVIFIGLNTILNAMWLEQSAHHAFSEITVQIDKQLWKRYKNIHIASYFFILNGFFVISYGISRFSEILEYRYIINICVVCCDILFAYTNLYAWLPLKIKASTASISDVSPAKIKENPKLIQESKDLGITDLNQIIQAINPSNFGFNQFFLESFSQILHEVTQKHEMICKGVIRLAIRETLQKVEISNYNEAKKVIEIGIAQWLSKFYINNSSEILFRMNQELIAKQSLFTFYI